MINEMEVQMSERKEFFIALSKMQGEVFNPKKDTDNPFFKSKYADLASIWDAVRPVLAKYGLSFMQFPTVDGNKVSVQGILSHVGGYSVDSTLTSLAKDAMPQSIGSAITYLRRYQMGPMLGVCAEVDDDGNAASLPKNQQYKNQNQHAQNPRDAGKIIIPEFEEDVEFNEPYREPEMPDEVKKGWRDLRAKLNKSLLAAKTFSEITAKQKAFSDMCKQGEKIWSQKTHHNEDETFGLLLAQHSERTKKADELASPIGIDRWIDLVKKSDEKEMVRRIEERDSQPRLQIQECEEALHDRACQLGFTSYSDLHGVEA